MEDACTRAIVAGLRTEVCYRVYGQPDCEHADRTYDLSHVNQESISSLSFEIYETLKQAKAIEVGCLTTRDGLANQDVGLADDQFFRIVRLMISAAIGRFEIKNDATLGVPHPIYELVAKNVFEALETVGCFGGVHRLDAVAALHGVLCGGEQIEQKLDSHPSS